jgi:hypothetical protein
MQDLKYIVRIDQKKPKQQHCWQVRIIRANNSFHRSFSDSKWGGKKRALEAAMKCRNKEVATRPPMNSYEQAIRPKSTNKSGIVGVRRTQRVVRRGKKSWSYDVWAATGTPTSGERTKTRYFSVNALGERKAKATAIALRREWEASLRASVERSRRARARSIK